MPRSTFYYHLKGNKTDKYFADKQAIKEVFEENAQRYGYRRITDELHAKGIVINHKKVFRLMKMLGIRGKKRKNEEYHSYKGEAGKIAKNLLNREFNAENAFEKLATDVTQFKVKDTKVYLSPIMDLYNNEIMSYYIFETGSRTDKRNAGRVEQETAERRNADTTLRPRLAIPTRRIPKILKRTKYCAEYVTQRQLYG